MTLAWLNEIFLEHTFGADFPKAILMGREAYRDYTNIVLFKLDRKNAPLPESLTNFQGTIIIPSSDTIQDRQVKILYNNGTSFLYEIPI